MISKINKEKINQLPTLMDSSPFSIPGPLGKSILENSCDPKNKIKPVITIDSKKKRLLKASQEVKILAIKPKIIITAKNPKILINTWDMEKTLIKIEFA